ncbi:MAG: hypothetical protein LW768_15755, partial [Rubrivivax sp.]|nr:hypothetical protein [Rubrivivax sp.]
MSRPHLPSAFALGIPLAAALVSTLLAGPVLAQRAAPSDAANGQVIVRFKDGADTMRAVALSSSVREGGPAALATAVRAQLQRRADALGARRGLALRSGNAIDGQTQVMR